MKRKHSLGIIISLLAIIFIAVASIFIILKKVSNTCINISSDEWNDEFLKSFMSYLS